MIKLSLNKEWIFIFLCLIFGVYSKEVNAQLINLNYSYDSFQVYNFGSNPDFYVNTYEKGKGVFNITIDTEALPVESIYLSDNDFWYRELRATSFYSSLFNISEIPSGKKYTDKTFLAGRIDKLNNTKLEGGYILTDYVSSSLSDTFLETVSITGFVKETKSEIFGNQSSGTYNVKITEVFTSRSVEYRLEESLSDQKIIYPNLLDMLNNLRQKPIGFMTSVSEETREFTYSNYQIIDAKGTRNTVQISGTAFYVSVPEPSTMAMFALGLAGLIRRQFKKQF
ncbi:MAG: PEP-CTERM sorting domain-containing protein [Paraglaciecola sp.]|nr:PEP-CTERM sorting domain-containing protein [Paraglaciecola sp.]